MGDNEIMKQKGNIYKRGNRWYFRVVRHGKQIRRSAATKELAQLQLSQMRLKFDREDAGACRITDYPFLRYVEKVYKEWAKDHKTGGSLKNDATYLSHLAPVFGNFKLHEIAPDMVYRYQRDRLAHVKGPTVNREVAYLKAVLQYAWYTGEIQRNPLARIKMLDESPERRPILSADDERRLVATCSSWLSEYVRWALGTGMRRNEIRALTWGDVDIEGCVAIVRNSKTGKSRTVVLSDAMVNLLKGKPAALPAAPLFTPVTGDGLTHAFARAAKAAQVPLVFHDLRHIYCSRLLAAGANLPEIASQSGHSQMSLAARYSHASMDRIRTLVARASSSVTGEVSASSAGKRTQTPP